MSDSWSSRYGARSAARSGSRDGRFDSGGLLKSRDSSSGLNVHSRTSKGGRMTRRLVSSGEASEGGVTEEMALAMMSALISR